jgi:hypothetical protein
VGKRQLCIVLNEHTDDDGATILRHACKLGLGGIASKRPSAPNRSGPTMDLNAFAATPPRPAAMPIG